MKKGTQHNFGSGRDFTQRLVRQYVNGQTERWGGAEWMRTLTHFRKNGTLKDAETCFRGIPERLKNVLHYSAMMKIYVQWKRAREVEAYFEAILGMTSDSKTLNYAYSTILNFYAKRSDVARAEKIRERMEARPGFLPNTHACSALMDVYVNAKDLGRAKRLYAWMEAKRIRADEITLTTLLRAHARAGDAEGAETVLRRVGASDWNALALNYAYSTILNLYAKKGDVAGAREVQKRMEAREGFRPNTETWSALMSVYAYAGDVDGAEKVLERMMDAKGIEANAITYSTLMQAYASSGDVRGAEKILKAMKAQGLQANAITYNTLMQAYARCGDVGGAEKILTQMKAQGVQTDVITYTTMIQTHCRRRDHVAAVRTLQKMLDLNLKPNERTFSLCAHSYFNPEDDDAFWTGLRKLSRHPHAVKTDNDFQASSFIFHPWIGAIARDAQRNGSKPIHPLSVVYLLDQIRRLPFLRGAGIRRETRIVALDVLHKILHTAPSAKVIDPCIKCIRSELESFACSSRSPPSKPWIECARGVIRRVGESHEGLSTLLTDLRLIHDKTSARRRTHPLAQLHLAPNPTKWKSIDDTLRCSKVRVIPASEISFDRLWFQGTSNTLGEGGLKRVVSAVVNGRPYAVVTSKDAYDSDRNDDADADVSKEDTSDSSCMYSAVTKSSSPEDDDATMIEEITHTFALRDAPAALSIAFKVEGCPVYGLPLCALQSLDKLVLKREGESFNWITPNLEYAVDLWLRAMRAVRDVHRTGHVHLDIKTQNFLVDYSAGDGLRLYIGDFGSVRKVNPVRHRVTEELGAYTLYMGSPERVFLQHVSFAADMWSMACVGIEIFRGCAPWGKSILMKFQDGSTANSIEPFLRRTIREKNVTVI